MDRFLDKPVAEAIERVRRDLATPFLAYGPCVEVLCVKAGDPAAVAHGLGRVPDGYLTVLELGGHVIGSSITRWTADTAFVVADVDNTRARLMFVACGEAQNA